MKINWSVIARVCATLGPTGYVPGSGTVATIVTAIVLWLLTWVVAPSFWVLCAVPVVAVSLVVTHAALGSFNHRDPSQIVIDELAGFVYAMCIFPHTLAWLVAGIVVFRFFDICKPLGIRWVESLGGAPGIIFDDILAGFYTQLVLLGGCVVYALWIA